MENWVYSLKKFVCGCIPENSVFKSLHQESFKSYTGPGKSVQLGRLKPATHILAGAETLLGT